MSSGLDEAFNVDEADQMPDNPFSEYTLPEDPSLDDIIRLGMTAFTDQMNDVAFIDPKFRARTLEVAHHFLNTAKDAIKVKSEIDLKDRQQKFTETKWERERDPNKDKDEPGIDMTELARMMAEMEKKKEEEDDE